ncbi:MAG: hypothetical protein D6B25_17145 [Desulfobulbaceae bacterium]|nr:MAG: hypothetical protein D6B25_17145 [Desulfobulbaceae bacterium]
MKLEWNDEYSTGNDEIDEQHKRWVGLFNRLDDVLLSKEQDKMKQTRSEVLKEMFDYVEYHFKFEEDYMASIGYPDAEKHWRMHKTFRNEIYKLYRDHEEGAIILNTEIMGTIRNWLIDHILKQDTKIMVYLREKE